MGLVLTLECPVGCRHCISNSVIDPKLSIQRNILLSRLERISKMLTYKVINITGGEPFYKYDLLLDTVKLAQRLDLIPTVITSGYWATGETLTFKYLQDLKESGLYSISVSLDKFHQEKIPLINVARIINIANEINLKTAIAYTVSTDNHYLSQELSELQNYTNGNILDCVPTITNKLVISGRAKHYLSITNINTNNSNAQNPLICSSMSPIIGLNGSVSCCCGPELPETSPLLIGNIDYDDPLFIQNGFYNNSIIPFIEVFGLRKMIDILNVAGYEPNIDCKELTIDNICNICEDLLSRKDYVEYFNFLLKNEDIRHEIAIKYMFMYGYLSPILEIQR